MHLSQGPLVNGSLLLLAVCLCACDDTSGTDGDADADSDTDGDGDADTDVDADTDGDGDTDTDSDVDGDGDTDTDADVDGDGDTDTDADVDGDGDTDTDADSDGDAGVVFPLRVAPTGRHLEDSAGRPFLIHGDTPWSLIVQLTYDEALEYLDDRQARGLDTVLVNLIEHQFCDDPPNNRAGDGPFLVPGDFSTPNDVYFDHAELVVQAAAERGIAVFLTPAYLGYAGGSEGWFVEMGAMEPEGCREYGDSVAERFADDQNIVWVHGGDYAPPEGSDGEACALEILAALEEGDPDALHTMHWSRHSSSLDEPAWAGAADLNAVYTDELSYPRCLEALEHDPAVPAFFIEGRYESEGGTPQSLRAQHYWATLSTIGGGLMGNRPMWLFDDGWQEALDSTLASDMSVMGQLLRTRRWNELEPDADHALVAGGGGSYGSTDWVAVARTSDGELAVAYLPQGGTVTIDFAQLADGRNAFWIDPTDGSSSLDPGSPFSDDGPAELTPPGSNAAGDDDWVLALE